MSPTARASTSMTPQSQCSSDTWRRCYQVIRCNAPTTFILFICCCDLCEALLFARRRRAAPPPPPTPTTTYGRDLFARKFSSTPRNNVGHQRWDSLLSSFDKSSDCFPILFSGEGTTLSPLSETKYHPSTRRGGNSSRIRMQLLSQLVGKIMGLLPSLSNNRIDDVTFDTGRTGYFPTIGATASQRIIGRGVQAQVMQSRYSKSNLMTTSSIGARRLRVQSFASSPMASSSPRTSTALRMVLSTPDTIIEQVSTEKLLDTLLNESVRTQSRHPIMMQFNPKRGWIWRQWRGTVFSETWKSGLLHMALATAVVFLYGLCPSLKDLLQGFGILWGQLLSVTTFTLTFFLNQSYRLWRQCYDYSRRLQGRLNDLGMTLAAHATRTKPPTPDQPSTYTPQSRQALELVSRYVRVFNLLTYASFTRSHRPILTPRGMRRLVERGILTAREREILMDAEVPATQRHNAVLVWLVRLFLEGIQSGVFEGGMGFEQQFMEKCHVIRAQYGAIGDELQGRMPLAYAHIVQVLLDVVLWMYPFMAMSSGMAWHISILGTGLLTMFYQGLFNLAKQFLDPYDNENYGNGDDPLVIDTLIAETNAGSVRWMNSFQQQPWNRQLLNDGEMYDSILPLRGYSAEDLAKKAAADERERQEREAAIKEKKRKQEESDKQRAEQILMRHVSNIENGMGEVVAEKRNGTAVLTPAGETLMDGIAHDGVDGNGTFMEVSRGEAVAMPLILPSSHSLVMNDTNADLEPNGEAENHVVAKMESNKVLTLADGTLVDAECDSVTMNVMEPDMIAATSQASEEIVKNATSPDVPVAEEDAADILPLSSDADVTEWDQLKAVPKFEESIDKTEEYDNASSLPLQPPLPLVSLHDTHTDNIIYDSRLSDEELKNFEWFEELGPDGQEYRLSQMLADEDWSLEVEGNEVEDPRKNKTMSYEEAGQRQTDIIERAENKLAKTKEIMSVSPGSNTEYDVRDQGDWSLGEMSVPPRRKVMDMAEPLYDQTRLDAISQLWGAPPEVLERNMLEDSDNSKQYLINDGVDFKNVYSLWGEDVPLDTATLDDVESSTPPPPSMDGFSHHPNDSFLPYERREEAKDLQDGAEFRPIDFTSHAGLDWWDETLEDGKELRLSQMLADEVYEEATQEGEEKPMTFEEFAEETEKLIEQAEDERKETEAIMNAPPNANFVEAAADVDGVSSVENSIVASDKFEEMVMSLAEGEGNNDEEPVENE